MPIRRGEEYLESLRDGRRLWLMGQRVEDITTHPALAGCARSVAAVFDLQHHPAHQDLLTMPSPSTGQRVSLAYLLPRSVDELARQRRQRLASSYDTSPFVALAQELAGITAPAERGGGQASSAEKGMQDIR